METSKILQEIIKRFKENGAAQVEGYNSFGYIKETAKAIYVSREKGKDTPISFSKLTIGIEAYKSNPSLYDLGPAALRDYGITHVTSPIWSLLHLIKKVEYSN